MKASHYQQDLKDWFWHRKEVFEKLRHMIIKQIMYIVNKNKNYIIQDSNFVFPLEDVKFQ